MDLVPVNTEYSDPGHIEMICDMFFRECVAQAREVKLKKCSPIAIAGMKTTAMDVRAPGRRPMAHIYCCNGSIHTSKQLHTVVLIKGLIYDLRESTGIYTGNLKG